jgi:hypothetical protein
MTNKEVACRPQSLVQVPSQNCTTRKLAAISRAAVLLLFLCPGMAAHPSTLYVPIGAKRH